MCKQRAFSALASWCMLTGKRASSAPFFSISLAFRILPRYPTVLRDPTLHIPIGRLHCILQHLDKPGNYARILFVDFSSAFNTIMPDLLSDKLTQLSVPTSICQWITSFLTDRQQLVRLGKLTSRTLTISTGAPQGCVLSPLLFSLYTNDCTSKDPSVKLLKFAEDTTVIGLIKDGDESFLQTGG